MPLRSVFQFPFRLHHLPDGMRNFFLHNFCQQFASSLILIAWPISLFEAGQKLPFITDMFTGRMERGIFAVLLFFIISRMISFILARPLARAFHQLGMTHTMVFGQALLVLSLLAFALFPTTPWLFFSVAILRGIGTFWYWTGHFAYFNSVIKPKYLGEEIGMFEFLSKLATVTAPLISTFLVVKFGYASVFLIDSLFVAVAAAVLFTLPNFHAPLEWSWNNFTSALRLRSYQRIALGMSGYAWEEIGLSLLWPVFLFIAFGHITTVGYILTGSSLLSLLLVYLTGVSLDAQKIGGKWQMAAGVGMGMLWIPRTFLSQFPMMLVFTESIDRLLSSFYGTLFTAALFSRARDEDIFIFYVNREIILSLTLIIGFSLGVLLLFWGWNWSLVFLSFVAGALASLSLRGDRL